MGNNEKELKKVQKNKEKLFKKLELKHSKKDFEEILHLLALDQEEAMLCSEEE